MSTATKERLGEKDFDLTDYSLKRLFLEHLPGDVSCVFYLPFFDIFCHHVDPFRIGIRH